MREMIIRVRSPGKQKKVAGQSNAKTTFYLPAPHKQVRI